MLKESTEKTNELLMLNHVTHRVCVGFVAAGEDVRDTEENRSSNSLQEEDSDCPRDSGCFIPSECSETKDDAEQVADATSS